MVVGLVEQRQAIEARGYSGLGFAWNQTPSLTSTVNDQREKYFIP